MKSSIFQQFNLLLWKNFVLMQRKWILTLCEILLPCLLFVVLIYLRQKVVSTYYNSSITYGHFTINNIPHIKDYPKEWNIAFCPSNQITRNIISKVDEKLNFSEIFEYKDEESMLKFLLTASVNDTANSTLAGIVFSSLNISHESNTNSSLNLHLPTEIVYKLRFPNKPRSFVRSPNEMFNPLESWYTSHVFPDTPHQGPREGDKHGGRPGYYSEGFLGLQHAIDSAIINYASKENKKEETNLLLTDEESNLAIDMQRMPYPPYLSDVFVKQMSNFFALFFLLGQSINLSSLIKHLVREREARIKESMKMMGMRSWLHWSSWFVAYIILSIVTQSILVLILKINVHPEGPVLPMIDAFILLMFLVVYAASCIFFAFAVSVFFSSANTAAAVGLFIYYITYFPFFIIKKRYYDIGFYGKLAICLLPNLALSFGGELIGNFEQEQAGITWLTINQPLSVDDDLTLLHVIIMLCLDSLLAMIIAWYKETAFPGSYGVPQPWYFPIQRSYWCGRRTAIDADAEAFDEAFTNSCHTSERLIRKKSKRYNVIGGNSDFFENEPVGLQPGIQIRKLRKEYGRGSKRKLAVDSISLNIYQGQISVLLGHNGAGKTTTISMLTGLIPPSLGTAVINGFDIRRDMDLVRQSLGLCPQHNILFDHLTVEEHLWFFAKMKGCPPELLHEEIDRYIGSLHLQEKRHTLSKALSGGMKRKLSVAIALIAGSKIIILDEPSSGLDADARRELWHVLQEERKSRTILLSTHFMDEADALGDRIAIMASGVLQCCGTPLFLKGKYGAGYHMTLVKSPDCEVSEVIQMVQKHVPRMSVQSNMSNELSLLLPAESVSSFEFLFTDLEEKREELGILSYGISLTTMEEVFLKVASYQETLEALQDDQFQRHGSFTEPSETSSNAGSVVQFPGEDFESSTSTRSDLRLLFPDIYSSGITLFFRQVYALLVKRFRYSMRSKRLTFAQLIFPVALVLMALISIKLKPSFEDTPPYTLNLDKFGLSYVTDMVGDMNSTSEANILIKGYTQQFLNNPLQKLVSINSQPGWTQHPNFDQYILKSVADKGIYTYSHRYEIGAEVLLEKRSDNHSGLIFRARFNNQAYHTPGITLNALNNGILNTINQSLSITTINHPQPPLPSNKAKDESQVLDVQGMSLAFNLVMCTAGLVASFAMFLVEEKAIKAKHLQLMTGVNMGAFWLSTFIWDVINYLIPVVLIIIAFAVCNIEVYVGDGRLWIVILIMVLFGWAVIPLVYILSNLFSVPSAALGFLTLIFSFTGFGSLIMVIIFEVLPNLVYLSDYFHHIFMVILPHYNLGKSLIDMSLNHEYLQICDKPEIKSLCMFPVDFPCCKKSCVKACFNYNENYMGLEPLGVGKILIALTIQGIIFCTINIMLETSTFKAIWHFINPERNITNQLIERRKSSEIVEDEDVKAEREKIHSFNENILQERASVLLKDVTRYYRGFCAVDHLCCEIPYGECFGLLGVNGAGKTTLFKMLTGDLSPTCGEAFINGYRLTKNLREIQRSMGYCPQFDALLNELTGRETLYLYARLRGVHEDLIPSNVEQLLNSLQFTKYGDVLVSTYSGGNKRKLSTAIALIGWPQIVCLDEPTTGMDPVSRRHLWNTLTKYRDSGRTLVLTSHSMEECEALCTKLGIMVNGQFKCFGTCQHLKAKFGEGYTLLVQLAQPSENQFRSVIGDSEDEPNDEVPLFNDNEDTIEKAMVREVIQFLERSFGQVELRDSHQGLLYFHIKSNPLFTWSRIFGLLEQSKTSLHIINYSISQTTLEQVFIRFARAQRPPDHERTLQFWNKLRESCCCCCCGTQNLPLEVDEEDRERAMNDVIT